MCPYDVKARGLRSTIRRWRWLNPSAALTLTSLASLTFVANAADGCKVLLCLAAPSWHDIPACVPPIEEVMRDLALGRPLPVCDISGPGNTTSHRWSSAPGFCPPQYTRAIDGPSSTLYSCQYLGAFSVDIDGVPWSQTWWQVGGDSVTQFFPSAKARLGSWDTRFDDDYARWLATQASPSDSH